MTEPPHVTLDPTTLNPVEQKLRGPLEEQLTSAMQLAADQVGQAYHGQGVDEVAVELLERAKSALHPDMAAGFEPDRAELRAVAEAIVRDNG